jgi:hypothetical protein
VNGDGPKPNNNSLTNLQKYSTITTSKSDKKTS